jgi:hypothetical protein
MKEEQILLAGCIVIVLLLVLSKISNIGCQQAHRICPCSGTACRCNRHCRCGCRREGMNNRPEMTRPEISMVWGLNSGNDYPHGNFATRTWW